MTAANTLNTHPTAPLNVKSSWIGHQSSMSRSSTLLQRTPDSHSMQNSCSAHTDRIQTKTEEKKTNFGQYAWSKKVPPWWTQKKHLHYWFASNQSLWLERDSEMFTHIEQYILCPTKGDSKHHKQTQDRQRVLQVQYIYRAITHSVWHNICYTSVTCQLKCTRSIHSDQAPPTQRACDTIVIYLGSPSPFSRRTEWPATQTSRLEFQE